MFPIPFNFPFRKKDGSMTTIGDEISAGGGGGYTLPTASAETKGGIKIGSGLSMSGEVLNNTNPTAYTLPTASAETKGGIKVGSGLAMDGEVLNNSNPTPYSLPTASSETLGGIKVGSGLSITDGVLSASGGSSSETWDTIWTNSTPQTAMGTTSISFTVPQGATYNKIAVGYVIHNQNSETSIQTIEKTSAFSTNIEVVLIGANYPSGHEGEMYARRVTLNMTDKSGVIDYAYKVGDSSASTNEFLIPAWVLGKRV